MSSLFGGLFGRSKKESEEEKSQNLAKKAVEELSCNNYYMEYQQCVTKKKRNYSDCVELMEKFRFCLVRQEMEKRKEDASSGAKSSKLFE